jgi:branched-subunit amino acid transport protein AzlD
VLSASEALLLTAAMAAVILACRAAPFLFFRASGGRGQERFVAFVERAVPPVAMTVLAVHAIASAASTDAPYGIPAFAAALATVAIHLWRRNALISIFASTALYMTLSALAG